MFKRSKSTFRKQYILDLNSVNQKKTTHYVYSVENFKIDFLYKPSKRSKGLLVRFMGRNHLIHLYQFSEDVETHIKIVIFCQLVIHCSKYTLRIIFVSPGISIPINLASQNI